MRLTINGIARKKAPFQDAGVGINLKEPPMPAPEAKPAPTIDEATVRKEIDCLERAKAVLMAQSLYQEAVAVRDCIDEKKRLLPQPAPERRYVPLENVQCAFHRSRTLGSDDVQLTDYLTPAQVAAREGLFTEHQVIVALELASIGQTRIDLIVAELRAAAIRAGGEGERK